MNDATAIDQFVRDATPMIEELVTTALRQGRQLQHVAVMLERGLDGVVRGGCGSRREIATKLGLDARLSAEQRGAILTAMAAAADAVPTIILLAGDGDVIVVCERLADRSSRSRKREVLPSGVREGGQPTRHSGAIEALHGTRFKSSSTRGVRGTRSDAEHT